MLPVRRAQRDKRHTWSDSIVVQIHLLDNKHECSSHSIRHPSKGPGPFCAAREFRVRIEDKRKGLGFRVYTEQRLKFSFRKPRILEGAFSSVCMTARTPPAGSTTWPVRTWQWQALNSRADYSCRTGLTTSFGGIDHHNMASFFFLDRLDAWIRSIVSMFVWLLSNQIATFLHVARWVERPMSAFKKEDAS